jgi:outer membrane protein TolC
VQQHGWSLGISLDIPLGGENFARRDESSSRAAQADAEVTRFDQNARTEFEALGPRIDNARRALVNLAEQEKKMALLMRGSSIQFEAGRRSLQQIIQGRDSYFNLQQRRLEQHHRLLLAQMRQLALSGRLLEVFGVVD